MKIFLHFVTAMAFLSVFPTQADESPPYQDLVGQFVEKDAQNVEFCRAQVSCVATSEEVICTIYVSRYGEEIQVSGPVRRSDQNGFSIFKREATFDGELQNTLTQWGTVELNSDGTYNIEARAVEIGINHFHFAGEIEACDNAHKLVPPTR